MNARRLTAANPSKHIEQIGLAVIFKQNLIVCLSRMLESPLPNNASSLLLAHLFQTQGKSRASSPRSS